LLSSCTFESRPLARVGSSTITVAEFLAAARAAGGSYPLQPDSAKVSLLDDMIGRELFRIEARERELVSADDTERLRRDAENQALLREMTQRIAPPDLPVSAGEVERYYQWGQTEARVQLIHAESEPPLRAARTQIESGEDFTAVALRFNTTGVIQPDGDFGYVPGGAMPEPLDGLIRAARLEELIGPVYVGADAWFLARVLERRPREVPEFHAIESQLEQQLRGRKQRTLLFHTVERLQRAYDFKLEPEAAQILFVRANRSEPDSAGLPDDLVLLARFQTADGIQRYTLGEAVSDLSGADRPNLTNTASIERWIETTVLQRIVLAEARARHLHQDPAVVQQVADRVDGLGVQALLDDEVVRKLSPPTDADVRAEYERRGGPSAPPMSEAPAEILQQLAELALEAKRSASMRAFADELRRKHPVVVDRALLDRVVWPLPAEALLGADR
jgi:hypothetical protein